ncbi:MAG: hypothetical protein Q4E28_00290 [Clostridia bacterium]|nr:hypothetical protein [Clostridia bacterium]
MKSGILNINGGTIKSTAETYKAPVADGGGVDGGDGNAIILDSHKAYADSMQVNISGNPTIVGVSGYAIEEIITDNNDTQNKPSSKARIKISGGTFQGEKGAIKTTDDFDEKNEGAITGGSFSSTPDEKLISKDEETYVDDKGNTVVGKKPEKPVDKKPDQNKKNPQTSYETLSVIAIVTTAFIGLFAVNSVNRKQKN